MKKKIVYLIFFSLFVDKINAQEVKFSWSLGSFGWSYNFIGKNGIAELELLKFNVSFEEINTAISTSIVHVTNRNNQEEDGQFYNSFLPLTIIYSPFKWQYLHISLYGRGGWEIGYTGGFNNPDKVSDGFLGAVGFNFGIFPFRSDFFKYASYLVSIFSEYTLQNEFKLGVSVDFVTVFRIVFTLWALSQGNTTWE